MMQRAALLIAALLVVAAAAAAATTMPAAEMSLAGEQMVAMEAGHTFRVPSEWRAAGAAADDAAVQLIFALKASAPQRVRAELEAVSTPGSARYGQHLSLEEATRLVAPTLESSAAVLRWLEQHGVEVTQMSAGGAYVHAKTTARQAARMFGTEFTTFQNDASGATLVRSYGPYHAPARVAQHLDFVSGVIGFPLPRRDIKIADADADATSSVTPSVLHQQYNISYTASAKNNSQAVAEFQGQYYSPTDLTAFFRQFMPGTPLSQATVSKVVGTNNVNAPGDEASLDIQYIMGVAPGVATEFWSVPSMDFWSDMTSFAAQVASTADAPLVFSISYGSQGDYPSSSYISNLDTQFAAMGARGISVIFASGDSGTGCSLCVKFEPSYPAVSPFVTSVGATTFINAGPGPEEAVTAFHSGGGFAWQENQPSYQSAAVANYLSTESDLPASFYYNKNGRSTPDVAALGWGFQVIISGQVSSIGGTSAAAPTFAGIVTLLNDIRLNRGQSPLGFLNPWIYKTAAADSTAFFDVTVGDNQHGCCGITGFKCAAGYDPVTGVGTANFAMLQQLI